MRISFPLFFLTALAVCANGCVPGGSSLYGDMPVPAVIYESHTLEHFYDLVPIPAPATRARVAESGSVEPGGERLSGDYVPAAPAFELAGRLDLASFPSMLLLPDSFTPVTHRELGWIEEHGDDDSVMLYSNYADCTYKVVASFDYDGKGKRDWLVVSTQQLEREDAPLLILWLLIENPPAEGYLRARLLGVEERFGISDTQAVMGTEAAAAAIVKLRGQLNLK